MGHRVQQLIVTPIVRGVHWAIFKHFSFQMEGPGVALFLILLPEILFGTTSLNRIPESVLLPAYFITPQSQNLMTQSRQREARLTTG